MKHWRRKELARKMQRAFKPFKERLINEIYKDNIIFDYLKQEWKKYG